MHAYPHSTFHQTRPACKFLLEATNVQMECSLHCLQHLTVETSCDRYAFMSGFLEQPDVSKVDTDGPTKFCVTGSIGAGVCFEKSGGSRGEDKRVACRCSACRSHGSSMRRLAAAANLSSAGPSSRFFPTAPASSLLLTHNLALLH